MKVFGERKRAAVAVFAAGTLMALAACTPAAGTASSTTLSGPAAASTAPATTTAPPKPSAEPGTSATVGALVPAFPQQLLPLMPGAKVVSSSFDKTTAPATVALVGSSTAPAADVLAFYTAQLEAQGFKAVPGETVGSVPSKDFLRGDNETVNISVVETAGISTFTIGANVAAESVK
ncbi:outer membrane receptor protein involved in Fe transport [Arthrobacter sp. V4I6]|uniref:hypothetical protein n=1 Tax=unclassified Arthrobacter TaxID=235627 RepID=UPI002780BFAA|nr:MULTISPECIES: hypothetical protein [unclassified Arthrobacter]MDQ0821777.1 outer membrane receptor protein involved in Fe transport [Arthrobacter sp. V1I7]MDQ0856041.1 outer membrane receptor protein involved in Fe transport [Arthrobacter sp. V4I6]